MNTTVIIHWQLRKGLGPEWVDKIWENGYDDLSPETTRYEVEKMAKQDFWAERKRNGSREREFVITEILIGE